MNTGVLRKSFKNLQKIFGPRIPASHPTIPAGAEGVENPIHLSTGTSSLCFGSNCSGRSPERDRTSAKSLAPFSALAFRTGLPALVKTSLAKSLHKINPCWVCSPACLPVFLNNCAAAQTTSQNPWRRDPKIPRPSRLEPGGTGGKGRSSSGVYRQDRARRAMDQSSCSAARCPGPRHSCARSRERPLIVLICSRCIGAFTMCPWAFGRLLLDANEGEPRWRFPFGCDPCFLLSEAFDRRESREFLEPQPTAPDRCRSEFRQTTTDFLSAQNCAVIRDSLLGGFNYPMA